MASRSPSNLTLLALLASLPLACTAEGPGGLAFRISGEEAAKEGFPVEVGNDHGHGHGDDETLEFVDDWTLEFGAYVVSFGNLRLASSEGETAFADDRIFVVDLSKDDPRVATFEELDSQRWDRFAFDIVAPPANAESVNADAAIVEQMRDNGWNYWVTGTARKGGRTVTFSWGVANPTSNEDCTNGRDNTQGLVVEALKTTEQEITAHTEHMFWTTLGTEVNEMRFDAIAAVADDSGEVTWEALADQMLSDLTDENGDPLTDENGNPLVYDPGAAALARNDLQHFIAALMATQVHLNGSGLCTVRNLAQ
jgi:hypothetical protein